MPECWAHQERERGGVLDREKKKFEDDVECDVDDEEVIYKRKKEKNIGSACNSFKRRHLQLVAHKLSSTQTFGSLACVGSSCVDIKTFFQFLCLW